MGTNQVGRTNARINREQSRKKNIFPEPEITPELNLFRLAFMDPALLSTYSI